MRTSRSLPAPIFWALLALLAVPGLAQDPATDAPSQATIDLIQRECLRAYPPELLAPMASGAEEIPDHVEENPEAQMQFLDKEIPADKGLFYPSLLEDVVPAFERYLKPGVRFLDLGSGDGRALFLASLFGAHATGIEYDPMLVETNLKAMKALADVVDEDRIKVIEGDFFKEPWSGYDVIFYFDLSSFEGDRVREKLEREMDAGAILLVNYEQTTFPSLEIVEVVKPVTVFRQAAVSAAHRRR